MSDLTTDELNLWNIAVQQLETLLDRNYFPGIRLDADALFKAIDEAPAARLRILRKEIAKRETSTTLFAEAMTDVNSWLPKVYQEGGGTSLSFDISLMPADKGTKLGERQILAVNERLAGGSGNFRVPTFFYPAGGSMYVEFIPSDFASAALTFLSEPCLLRAGTQAA